MIDQETQTRLIYKRESLLSLVSRHKLKLFYTIIGMLVLILNIAQQITMCRESEMFNQIKTQQHQILLMNNTPIDHCPFEKITWSTDKHVEHLKHDYFKTNSKRSVSMKLCFGPVGPVIELRQYINNKQMTGGIDLNPFEFRQLFTNISEIEQNILYIPTVMA